MDLAAWFQPEGEEEEGGMPAATIASIISTRSSFSGKRITQAPGGSSHGVGALLRSPSPVPIPCTEEAPADAAGGEGKKQLSFGGEDSARTPVASSFSGKRIVQAPGGSSQWLARHLWGASPTDRAEERRLRASQQQHGRSNSSKLGDMEAGKGEVLEEMTMDVPWLASSVVVVEEEGGDEGGGGGSMGMDPLAAMARMACTSGGKEEGGEGVTGARNRSAPLSPLPSDSPPPPHDAGGGGGGFLKCCWGNEQEEGQEAAVPPSAYAGQQPLTLQEGRLAALLRQQCALVDAVAVAFFVHEAKLPQHVGALRRFMLGSECALLKEFVAVFQVCMLCGVHG